jgi:hypothetical protein
VLQLQALEPLFVLYQQQQQQHSWLQQQRVSSKHFLPQMRDIFAL